MKKNARLPVALLILAPAAGCGALAPSAGSSATSLGDAGNGVAASDAAGSAVSTLAAPPTVAGLSGCGLIAPPIDCGRYAARCDVATPIAGGADRVDVDRFAITTTDVVFRATIPGKCPPAIYRASKNGGYAHFVAAAPELLALEADDDAIYIAEPTDDAYSVAVSALSGTERSAVGTVHGNPAWNTYWQVGLTRTLGGVVEYDPLGPSRPSFWLVKREGLAALATDVAGASLGSVPAFDGETLFFSWSDPVFISSDNAAYDTRLVGIHADGGSPVAVGEGACTRIWPSVALSGGEVIFVTEDASNAWGIARAPKNGGPSMQLVAPQKEAILALVADDRDVFFVHSVGTGSTIESIPVGGGPVRTVWRGDVEPQDLRADGDSLYFLLPAHGGGEIPRPGSLVVRVAKSGMP